MNNQECKTVFAPSPKQVAEIVQNWVKRLKINKENKVTTL